MPVLDGVSWQGAVGANVADASVAPRRGFKPTIRGHAKILQKVGKSVREMWLIFPPTRDCVEEEAQAKDAFENVPDCYLIPPFGEVLAEKQSEACSVMPIARIKIFIRVEEFRPVLSPSGELERLAASRARLFSAHLIINAYSEPPTI